MQFRKLNDPEFLQQLIAVAPKGRFSVYLQFDGVLLDGQKELRGGDFRSIREKAIELGIQYNGNA